MPRFHYEAVDKDGIKVVGSAEAPSKEALLASFRAHGLVLVRWLDQSQRRKFLSPRARRQLKHRELLTFTRDLAQLLKSGLSVDRALDVIIAAASEKGIIDTAKFLKDSLREGKALSDAMSSRPADFTSLYVNMVRVGEMGGVLPEVMSKVEEFMRRSEETKRFIISTSIYPSVLIAVGIISVLVIMGFVVPKFAGIFNDLGVEVPFSTRVLIDLSEIVKTWWWLIPVGGGLLLLFLRRFFKTRTGREKLDTLMLRLPIFGKLIADVEVSHFTRTLGTLILSGVPLLKALSIVKDIAGNQVIRRAVEQIHEKVREGKRITTIMEAQAVFPPIAVEMAAVGEETGRLGEMLVRASEELERKIQTRLKTYLSLLEPAAILVMGLIIGGIVISMLTAIFGINEIQF
ncbi:MAG: type II secretion system F family protein [Deltaproteobacteria bacterium]|nr:type II secretion system F family protein [Deltaproteobacteria bacterium]MBW2022316.1 type II secretion system F family protein [Deltaproteobacteria bacterium]MBW2082572.1 type II secretion system F family protein [Deltaproteobacteria bacterium]HDM08994.1 type II secretion system F family protein [Desulfobacteraceae bacterium]